MEKLPDQSPVSAVANTAPAGSYQEPDELDSAPDNLWFSEEGNVFVAAERGRFPHDEVEASGSQSASFRIPKNFPPPTPIEVSITSRSGDYARTESEKPCPAT
jgi:hypothetical protein